jgi:TldD protein
VSIIDNLFFQQTGLDCDRVCQIVSNNLSGNDDGELFLEYRQSENIVLDDGCIKNAGFDIARGFGFRVVSGETIGYIHDNELSEIAINRAGKIAQVVHGTIGGRQFVSSKNDYSNDYSSVQLYTDMNPLTKISFATKIRLLEEIDIYARSRDPRVKQVSASINGSWQVVHIIRGDGSQFSDIRPLVRLNISIIMVTNSGRMEIGNYGIGGRVTYDYFIQPKQWQYAVDEAFRQALVNLDSIPAPAGDMVVVLGSGWPGVLLHEAIGHGLEGDFNRKQTSAFSNLIGQKVASSDVTVVDDGTMIDRRGSISVDDEGTPSSRTMLIENGILKGYLFDRLNARLMNFNVTGNGRRQSYASQPLPRMTNTFMLAGSYSSDEILSSVKKGVYAVNFGGGQVDITSGKFVFSATEAYLIENGRVGSSIKGATLIGNGPDVLTKVTMIGNDLKLDDGVGTCCKAGQSVPVGVGQPTIKISNLTVGGTVISN